MKTSRDLIINEWEEFQDRELCVFTDKIEGMKVKGERLSLYDKLLISYSFRNGLNKGRQFVGKGTNDDVEINN